MHSKKPLQLVALAVLLCLLGVAGTAQAVSVSTTDGVTLTLTSTGAFSSLTVNGNTVTTLSGVAGGFFIVPMDGVIIDATRHTYYAGTQITGTATQNGSNVTLTGTAQNQTFSITLTGGLPYIKVDGTVTGNGTDHAFLIDFRLPVDATGWTWGNRINQPQTIASGSSNWYFANVGFHWQWHPQLSINPYGTVTTTASPAMGLSLTPLFYPPASYAIEYNSQTGFFIEFELGTTSKTTKHPNTADFHFVFYQHNPKWGNRSAVQRFQSFFPQWFRRSVSGGNWFIDCSHANYPTTPTDFRLKFGETTSWADSTTQADGMLMARYIEPWCWHIWTPDSPSSLWAETYDVASNWTYSSPPCHCPGNRGMTNVECAQATFNSMAQNPDGTYVGPDNPNLWTDYSSSWRWICNPDPEIGNWEQFTPGTTRAGNAEFREAYYEWGTAPGTGNKFDSLYLDSVGGYWAGWDVVHNFNPNHWTTYDFSPGIYWGSIASNNVNYGDGLVCMYEPYSNVEFMKYIYAQMRKEGRPIMANSGPCFENVMAAPFLDMWGTESYVADDPPTTMAMMRSMAGKKPLSYVHSRNGYNLATSAELNQLLPFAIYPGADSPDQSNSTTAAEYTSLRSTYQTYMPIFDTLDAAGWNPITAAVPTDTTETLERFGPDSSGAIYYALEAPNAGTATVTVYYADLGWASNPSVTVTALLGAAPSTSYSSGNLVLSFGSITAGDARVVKIVYNGTPTVPVANFSGSPTSGSAPLSVTFTDSSTHTPTAWYWDFGDGNVSTVQSPSHSYAAGQYIVSLTASNASGQDTMIKDNYITANGTPAADFAFYRVWGVVGAETTAEFKDKSTNSPTSWSWTFGDGGTATTQNPTHAYTAAGTYNVGLTAYNASGNNTVTKTGLVHILPIKCNFSATPTFGVVPLATTFTDESAGTPTSWSWTFGDGGTSTAQNPSHTYTTTGYFNVALTVHNAAGSDSLTQNSYICACNEVLVYPTSYSMDVPAGGNGHVTSGSLSNLQTADGTCMVFTSDTTDPTHYYCELNFVSATGYTQSQIVGSMVEYRAMTDDANDTCCKPSWNCPACPIHPMPTTLTTWSYSRPASTSLDASGNASMSICQYPITTKKAINISVDMMRWHLYLKPGTNPPAPVANFTGNPTSGNAPLAVAFTDTSTNISDRVVVDLRRLQHLHRAEPEPHLHQRGQLHGALTATNVGGNNTNTKTNYITVNAAAIPTFVAAGAVASGTGAITPALPSGFRPTTSCCCSWRRRTSPSPSPIRTAARGRKSPTRRRGLARAEARVRWP